MVFSFRLKQFFSSQEFLSLVYMTHSGGENSDLGLFRCRLYMVIWMNFTSLGNGADKGGSTLSKLGSNSTAQLYPKVGD